MGRLLGWRGSKFWVKIRGSRDGIMSVQYKNEREYRCCGAAFEYRIDIARTSSSFDRIPHHWETDTQKRTFLKNIIKN